jgi:hypothetical protein
MLLVWKIMNASFFEYVVSCMEYGPTFFFMTNETAWITMNNYDNLKKEMFGEYNNPYVNHYH